MFQYAVRATSLRFIVPLIVLSISSAAARAHCTEAGGIVAIGGSITEIVYALGEEDRLVARDTTSLYPNAALQLPDVGYIRALSPEGVMSVDPCLILALEGAGPPEALDVLEKASVPVVLIPERFDRQGIIDKIHAVGKAIGAEGKAAELARKVETDVSAAERRVAGDGKRKRVLFVLSMQGGRILAAGRNTAAAGIIEMAGGINAVTDIEGYKHLSDEAVIEAAPDMVLMMDRTGNHAIDDEALFAHPALSTSPAAGTRNVVRMGGAYLLGFGPRTAAVIEELSSAIANPDE